MLKMKVLSLSKQGNSNIAFKSNLFNELKLQRFERKTDLDGGAGTAITNILSGIHHQLSTVKHSQPSSLLEVHLIQSDIQIS